MKKLIFLIFTLFLLTLLVPAAAYSKPYIISPENLGVDTSWAQFSVTIATEKKVYREGERLVATITTNRDCHILVYYTNENGSCLILYPNKYEAKNFIKAGESLTIGKDPKVFALAIDSPKTRDYLQVIATDEPIDVASLEGIKNPEEFVNRLRLILRERVEDRAGRLRATSGLLDLSLVNLDKSVYAIGTTDYLCNYSSYVPAEGTEAPPVPTVATEVSMLPLIQIRSVDVGRKDVRIVGPDAPPSDTSKTKGNLYIVNADAAEIKGTVQYQNGVKKVLINGQEPTIKRLGSSRDMASDSEADKNKPRKTIDFVYVLKGLQANPSRVVITAEGVDGKKSARTIEVRKGE
jgi:hypothetical protein